MLRFKDADRVKLDNIEYGAQKNPMRYFKCIVGAFHITNPLYTRRYVYNCGYYPGRKLVLRSIKNFEDKLGIKYKPTSLQENKEISKSEYFYNHIIKLGRLDKQ